MSTHAAELVSPDALRVVGLADECKQTLDAEHASDFQKPVPPSDVPAPSNQIQHADGGTPDADEAGRRLCQWPRADALTYTTILQSQVARLDQWAVTADGVWRSVRGPRFRNIAAAVSFNASRDPDEARFRLVMRAEADKQHKGKKPEEWAVLPLHKGWTALSGSVLDFSGRLMPAPEVEPAASCAAVRRKHLAEPAKQGLGDEPLPGRDLVSPQDMQHTLDFSGLDDVRVECTHDPGEVIVHLLSWNLLATLGTLHGPYFGWR